MVKNITNYKNSNIKKKHKGSIILIGNFDGLHLGHQKLFHRASILKKKTKLNVGVYTFYPIPKMFFFKDLKNYRISNFNQKLKLFKKFNVDFVINQKFNKKFSKINCDKFIENILYKKLKANYIFVSSNFRFGNKREGDVKLLKSLEKKYNYKIVEPSALKTKNIIISSTLIRSLLQKKYGYITAKNTSILYGGSCNPANAQELFSQEDGDGGLIGGASLKANDFVAIVNSF